MLPSDAPCGGLEAYRRRVTPYQFFVVKMGKIFETFWRALTHYLINVWLKECGMLPNYDLGVAKKLIQGGVNVLSHQCIGGKT